MDEERVIVEVEKHAIIYDTTDPFYKDNLRKDKAWNEVAEAVGSDADTCKARWRSLRDSYVKNRKKFGAAGRASKEWKYGDAMAFLLPHIQPKSSKGNLNNSQNDEERSSTPQSLSGGEDSSRNLRASRRNRSKASSSAPTTSGPSTSRSRSPRDRTSAPAPASPPPRPIRRGQRPQPDTDIEERLMSLLEQPAPKPRMPEGELDEAYHFALSIVPTLHRLNQDSRQQAKIEILTLLHNLERSQAPQVTVELQPVTEDFKVKEEEEQFAQTNWHIDREG